MFDNSEMRSSLSVEKISQELPGERSPEHGGSDPPYCLSSFKRHKVCANPQIHTNIGPRADEPHGTCNADVTTIESAFENLKGRPSNLHIKVAPIELKSLSMKPPVLQCKASSMNVEMESLRVPKKVELHNAGNNSSVPKHIDILCCSDTSSTPCVLRKKYPFLKIRKGVTINRDFPQGCGRQNLDSFSKFDVRISEENQMIFEAEKEQIRGEPRNVGSGFASKGIGKILMDIDDKVTAESEIATETDKAELLKNVYSECKLNHEASIDTIPIVSSPPSKSLQENSSSKTTSNINDGFKSWMEKNQDDPGKYSRHRLTDVNNSVVSHSVNNKYVNMTHLDGSKSVALGQQGVKTNDGESATRMGVTTLDYEAATGDTGRCSEIVYELMGHRGSYYTLQKDDDIMYNDGSFAAQESQEAVKTSDNAIVAIGGCRDSIYELMGQKGSNYLLLKFDETNIHVPYVEADVEAVNITQLGKPSTNLAINVNQEALCRSKVREVLNLFQKTLNERLLEIQGTRNSKAKNKAISSHIYEEVAMLLKQQKGWIYMNERVLGAIPGVEVGDQFQYRAELVIVGVHVQFVADFDYIEKDSKKIATSIVSIRCYSDDEELTDVIYCCEGGKETMAEQNSKDKKLVHGKVALKNSMDEESPVRVIRGDQSLKGKSITYTYDGLYIVSKFWPEIGQNGKLVYMFKLNKMPGQPKLRVNKLGRHGKSKARFYRTLIDDISYGKEKISIPVVNDIDTDKPPNFNYINKMVYPQLRKSANARGCHCISGCSDDVKCSCVVKNGGIVPFNEDGALLKAKPIVHECGPSCKCPPSCMNRVSQHGPKIQLEVFKTEMRGWGIRSRNFISSGSFICEYIGELLDDKQAEERIGFDEYLFDIGDEDGFAIDAAKIGNVGRFVNHSCSPNLFAQDVLFDHDDKMMPHVMLFATKNIPPLQELSYDYNYKIGHVSDSNGNVKEKTCHCGSRKCTGRMY